MSRVFPEHSYIKFASSDDEFNSPFILYMVGLSDDFMTVNYPNLYNDHYNKTPMTAALKTYGDFVLVSLINPLTNEIIESHELPYKEHELTTFIQNVPTNTDIPFAPAYIQDGKYNIVHVHPDDKSSIILLHGYTLLL